MRIYLNGRQVFDYEIDGFGQDSCDWFFASAVFEDGTSLTEDELNQLAADYPEIIEEHLLERLISKAESLGNGHAD